jgi:hypothetical protein
VTRTFFEFARLARPRRPRRGILTVQWARLKGTETLITPATCPFMKRSLLRTSHGRRASGMPETALNGRFLSFKHSSVG